MFSWKRLLTALTSLSLFVFSRNNISESKFLSRIERVDLDRRSINDNQGSPLEHLPLAPVDADQPPSGEMPTNVVQDFAMSPSLGNPAAGKKRQGAFELKFLIDEDQAADIIGWARHHLEADPHFDPDLGDGYHVNSLYLDTPQFDVFHRREGFCQQKYRLRRYGCNPLVWFEQKRKRKGLVRKRRVPVDQAEIPLRLDQPAEVEWPGHWFRRKLDEQQLRPVCQVTYQRLARFKNTDEGVVRLTIDDRLRAIPAEGWTIPTGSLEGVSLLEGKRILELKFRGAMPGMFRQLVEEQRLQVASFSKYRTSVAVCIPPEIRGDVAPPSAPEPD